MKIFERFLTSLALITIGVVLIIPAISGYNPIIVFIVGGAIGYVSHVISGKLHES